SELGCNDLPKVFSNIAINVPDMSLTAFSTAASEVRTSKSSLECLYLSFHRA
ncbi:hypothetical protein A2U01_0077586, partial [Trifolium medium]|nr:hypothetical protein [Trifolium medium]